MTGHYDNCPIPLGEVTSTIGSMLLDRARRWPDHVLVATIDESGAYQFVRWKQVMRHIASLAQFLQENGITEGERVAVFSHNSYEMLVWELCVASIGAISVPIFAEYDAKSVDYILEHAAPSALFVNGDVRLEKALSSGASKGISLIVTKQNSAYMSFDACLAKPVPVDALETSIQKVKLHDVCFIQYTSGTTGDPKGVMLSHCNIMSQHAALANLWDISHQSRFLAHLPWHHSFGGLFERFCALYNGAILYLDDSRGKDIDRLLWNMSRVKPTHFFSVPRIHGSLVREARNNPEVRDVLCHPELRFVFTAAAPLSKEVGSYFRSQNVRVMEGWGLTETSPCVTLTPLGKERVHSYVGEPIPGCEILITDENEIHVRGPNVMQGYFRDEERTKEAIDSYGWFNTGDLGEITDYGLRIIGRRDGVFKLSNGEKVSADLVENTLLSPSRWIRHAFVVGAGLDFVAALIFPNFANLEQWAVERGKSLTDREQISKDEGVQNLIAGEITGNMAGSLPKIMEVQGIAIVPAELSLEQGELTPAMKGIRYRVISRYSEWWQTIYHPSRHVDKQPFVVMLREDYSAFTW